MKKFLLAALLALPLTALGTQARADNHCSPLYRVGISVGIVYRSWCGCDYGTCKVKKGCGSCKEYYHSCPSPNSQPAGVCCGGGGGGGGAPAGMGYGGGGPWYGMWPYNAHFQTPAPTGYPYWPAGQTYGGYGAGYAAAPQAMPQQVAAPQGDMGYYGNGLAVMPRQGNFAGAVPPANVQAGYYQAPSYWYGR